MYCYLNPILKHYNLSSCFVYAWSHYCYTQEARINFESSGCRPGRTHHCQGEDKVDWKRVPLPPEHPPRLLWMAERVMPAQVQSHLLLPHQQGAGQPGGGYQGHPHHDAEASQP